ncbi:hypothetical protein AWJ20_2041 [Sugiyamaella lignohabitans]|uniref:ABC transporter domain-containing protein n=1 Tax=Sugiyamaella lignohabitans TaxID=796027 RepID=A0A167ETZ7_9ASCO|nr:uncharacterized protein AWJ20_2041 [Sugiyamaella lignohabitans]ANB14451.1 hypothetical protein AWJ20_2041 [Sugiyamaella lignohabitans]
MSIVKIQNGLFRKLGEGSKRTLIFKSPLSLDIKSTDRWAITGPRKTELLEILASKHIPDPPLSRTYPFLANQNAWPSQVTQLIEFSNADVKAPHISARYESLREELDETLNESLLAATHSKDQAKVDHVLEKFSLKGIENRWIVGLSNGQSRRARLAKALLRDPKFLLVDEPFVGLDPFSRKQASDILSKLSPEPHVVVGLRYQDEFPSWITHVAITDRTGNGISHQGPIKDLAPYLDEMRRDHIVQVVKAKDLAVKAAEKSKLAASNNPEVIKLDSVSVSYKGEPIFSNLTWKVKKGEKWHLRGDNGTGKSTLLSLLTGDHPQSWNPKISLFGEPRGTGKQSYFSINEKFGHVSPEIHALFPMNLTVKEAISTGFVVGYYIPLKKLSQEQEDRIDELLSLFEHISKDEVLRDLSVSNQKIVMFLRGLAKRPDILILDEAFSAMAEESIDKCKQYIDLEYDGTLIVVGHIEDEVPLCHKYIRLTAAEPEFGEL